MAVACRCGNEISLDPDRPVCVKCGTPCCTSCAFALEAATYCGRCAETVLDGRGVPLTVATKAGPPWLSSGEHPAVSSADSPKWLILVARDQPDLFGHLVRAFSRDDKVQILVDRRKDYSRNPPGMEERLRIHGAAVVRRRA
jgi:hypothetical protein